KRPSRKDSAVPALLRGCRQRNALGGHQRFEQGDGFRERLSRRLLDADDADAFCEIERGPAARVLGPEIRAVLGEELDERREAPFGCAEERGLVRHGRRTWNLAGASPTAGSGRGGRRG